jgi:hypothetical protein
MPRSVTLSFIVVLLLGSGACARRPAFSAATSCRAFGDTITAAERLSRMPPLHTGVFRGLAANRSWAPPKAKEILSFRARRYIPFGWPLQGSTAPGTEADQRLARIGEVQSVPVYVEWEQRHDAAPEWIYLPLSSPCVLQGFWVGDAPVSREAAGQSKSPDSNPPSW